VISRGIARDRIAGTIGARWQDFTAPIVSFDEEAAAGSSLGKFNHCKVGKVPGMQCRTKRFEDCGGAG
jgi:hypothetical protein